ncbi:MULTISPECIES: thiamine pyrophosphate-dependent enzyme [unclassified Roseofilum]|uniref:thiamine pyrophosphate-dependent enzyme n=1 Tax=unclassified Roseofilum TaxID=2620099 RepID=UPI000E9AF423|nr:MULTISPECIES: thiamine pyrophosphate-dependent enzyme [unclassified Roseofilum]MBP0009375.1 thiamine pyrophosphate-binding protein [Roseofilum sp. Belize Diploria]MBP0033852.1 thiamine pyrophosphate-binding protein [Roseofilum sp. Belize BBD 4]HBQ99949.1 acetolactate synthase [Cyanobacteria bacterium UBA11691]
MGKEIFDDDSSLAKTIAPLSEPCIEDKEQLDQTECRISVAQAVVKMLELFDIKKAFGVSGGAIAPVWNALEQSSIQVFHFRHEAGAAFAATEAYFVNSETVVVFTTTGPGLTNALTGLFTARSEGAKVILISPCTSAAQRDQFAFQETSLSTMPSDFFSTGTLFDFATILESEAQLPMIQTKFAKGLAHSDGFVAHISIPMAVESHLTDISLPQIKTAYSTVRARKREIAHCAKLLREKSFAIWLGFGARGAAKQIRKLAERMDAPVICSPRAKGIFPEDHPLFLGVSGFGGHSSVLTYMQEYLPKHVLVLGTHLGEFTSFWSPTMVPQEGFIQVDSNPSDAYSNSAKCLAAIQSDVKVFLKQLLEALPKKTVESTPVSLPRPEYLVPMNPQSSGLVRPQVLMQAIQNIIVDGSDAVVMTEAGSSFAWGTHTLRFKEPGRYRVSMGFGSMGHAATGVVGAALALQDEADSARKAVAIVGDGAMLMNSEVNTAVTYQIPAVWIVLNNRNYNLCDQGMKALGFKNVNAGMTQTDFALVARGMGAKGVRITQETEIEKALAEAMKATEPFVIDVEIDPTVPAPLGERVKSLMAQGARESKGLPS